MQRQKQSVRAGQARQRSGTKALRLKCLESCTISFDTFTFSRHIMQELMSNILMGRA